MPTNATRKPDEIDLDEIRSNDSNYLDDKAQLFVQFAVWIEEQLVPDALRVYGGIEGVAQVAVLVEMAQVARERATALFLRHLEPAPETW